MLEDRLQGALDLLDRAGLLALREEVDARLAALDDQAATAADGLVGNEGANGGGVPTKGGRAGRGGWVEMRMVNGCGPYAYRRWWEGGRKRTRYIGKVKR